MPGTDQVGLYSGLKERAIPGTHERILQELDRRHPRTVRLLDLGAGTGAFVERLHDAGYSNILAADIDADSYRAAPPFRRVDLNAPFAAAFQESFDLITAVEVIEHLENPANFFRQAGQLLRPEGELLVTTPNIESLPARLKFLLGGRLHWFDGFQAAVHITPLNTFLLRQHAEGNGLELVAERPLFEHWPLSGRLVRMVCRCLAPFLSGAVYGEYRLFILRRKSASAAAD